MSSLEFHYVGMDDIMTGWNAFDWSTLDATIQDAASRQKHVIWNLEGQPLRLPQFLIDDDVALIATGDCLSPQYDDPKLLEAFRQLIIAMGRRYDGLKSIAFIQLGLLGKWGEWHTWPDNDLLSQTTMDSVIHWYAQAFVKTKLQVSIPLREAQNYGIGLHDDSFAFSTLDGAENGGQHVSWFFWPKVKKAGETAFWKKSVMGGETRPELQSIIFTNSYESRSPFKQDFMKCVETTHATYMFHHSLFQHRVFDDHELENAKFAHVRMGYGFQVTQVLAEESSDSAISVQVTVKQVGVAPFYYPLQLSLELSWDNTRCGWSRDHSRSRREQEVQIQRTSCIVALPREC